MGCDKAEAARPYTIADRVQSSAAVSFLHPIESVVLPVLDLDPVLGPATSLAIKRRSPLVHYQHRHASVGENLRCLTPQHKLPQAATPMRAHDYQVAASGLCCFDNRSSWVLIRNMQEFYRYPDLLRHSSGFIEHFACTFLADCVKAIKHFPRNPSLAP